ncbi:MAG: hypothetical protein ACYTGC_17665 [Planctomycetota bacterium]|jgi:hypothetical protein
MAPPRSILMIWIAFFMMVLGPGVPALSADTIDLEFAGGKLSEYVAALRRKVPEANIIVLPEAASVTIPRVKLKSVDMHAAITLLKELVEQDENRIVKLDVRTTAPTRADAVPVYTVRAQFRDTSERDLTHSQVLAVADLMDAEVEPDALLTAVETALALEPEALPPAQIKFHQATGLLIVRGHMTQTRVIQEIVNSVRANVEGRLASARAQAEQDALEAEAMYKNQLSMQEQEAQRLRDELSQASAENNELRSEIAKMQLRLEEMAVALRRARGGGE